jgi:hypothetical protein
LKVAPISPPRPTVSGDAGTHMTFPLFVGKCAQPLSVGGSGPYDVRRTVTGWLSG